eukprot:CAMPEP_0204570956 /NCGR_PEP_ID=MMETSP0661-20131031/38616_1 /ASSEMBLY_ACC=CAM_ASM_000606 /TAXON_ID=109239 /ORGANISM="Alexandrium margalefi, Strain AMGDE01CS-322" /LENGTH=115 /DNA_ID=CAMNT_0051579181 /DNA_START=125 /DNA_END=472 /DNA_ORIENTATION=+
MFQYWRDKLNPNITTSWRSDVGAFGGAVAGGALGLILLSPASVVVPAWVGVTIVVGGVAVGGNAGADASDMADADSWTTLAVGARDGGIAALQCVVAPINAHGFVYGQIHRERAD